jgi:hypothetical protein
MPCGGERRERSAVQMPGITASAASFFFHPVAQKYEFTLLLSSFTHTRANARAYARKGARVRGVGKEERSLGFRPCRVTQMSRECHRAAPVGPSRRRFAAWRRPSPRRTRHGTWPPVGPRRVCQSGRAKDQRRAGQWFLPGQKSPEMAVGTDAISSRVCFRGPNVPEEEVSCLIPPAPAAAASSSGGR